MSKGSQVVPVRITRELLDLINAAIESRNDASPQEPMSLSSWIRAAINEKLRHLVRGRSKSCKPPCKDAASFTCLACHRRFPILEGRSVAVQGKPDIDMCSTCFDTWRFTG